MSATIKLVCGDYKKAVLLIKPHYVLNYISAQSEHSNSIGFSHVMFNYFGSYKGILKALSEHRYKPESIGKYVYSEYKGITHCVGYISAPIANTRLRKPDVRGLVEMITLLKKAMDRKGATSVVLPYTDIVTTGYSLVHFSQLLDQIFGGEKHYDIWLAVTTKMAKLDQQHEVWFYEFNVDDPMVYGPTERSFRTTPPPTFN